MPTRREPATGPCESAELVTTERCNQRCLFCYAQHRAENPDPDLDTLRALFEEVRTHTSRIILCGREALLRPDILDVLRLARDLGLAVSIATNAQILSRAEMVEAISLAGVDTLQVSFHFPDRETFAVWTRSDLSAYDRVLAGLRNVRDHNRAHPERRLGVTTETEMAAFNEGRLDEIRRTLEEALQESFERMRLGALIPTLMHGPPLGSVLEPVESRRRELATMLAAAPPGLDIKLDKAPLCLVPGQEERSLGVGYIAHGARMIDNNAGTRVVADNVVSINAATEVAGELRANPYRTVCRTCNLLPACRARRTHWEFPAFAPTRDQKPVPVRDRTLREVLLRVPDALPEDVDRSLASLPDRDSLPRFAEQDLLDAVAALPPGPFRMTDWFVDGAPIVAIDFAHTSGTVSVRIEPAGAQEGDLGRLVDYLAVAPATGWRSDEAVLTEAARFLAGAEFPGIAAWAGDRFLDARTARFFRSAWQTLGERLWPGSRLGSWRNEGVRYDRADGLSMALGKDGDDPIRIALGHVAQGLDLTALRAVWPEAPETPVLPEAAIDVGDGPPGAPPFFVFEFVCRSEPEAPHRFLVETARPGERYLLERGGLGAWYRDGDRFDATSRIFLALLGAVSERMKALPADARSVETWQRLLVRAAGSVEGLPPVSVRMRRGS